jgi:hypothetical protein
VVAGRTEKTRREIEKDSKSTNFNPILLTVRLDFHAPTLKRKYYFGEKSSFVYTFLKFWYTHKTSGFKTSGFKTSCFKTSGFKTSGLQNVRFTKLQVSKRLVSKRQVFKFDILIKQKVFVFVIFTYY